MDRTKWWEFKVAHWVFTDLLDTWGGSHSTLHGPTGGVEPNPPHEGISSFPLNMDNAFWLTKLYNVMLVPGIKATGMSYWDSFSVV